MKELIATTVGTVERKRESYTLINKKQSMKNALLNIYIRDG